MSRTIAQIALLVSAAATGLFAGLLWTFAVGVDPMYATLDGPTYVQVQQTMIKTIDAGIPPVLVLTILGPVVALSALALHRHWRSRTFVITLSAFLLFLIGVMAFTIALNVPINNAVLSWNAASPPADWMQARERWDELNSIRTPVAILAFGLYLVALVQPLPKATI